MEMKNFEYFKKNKDKIQQYPEVYNSYIEDYNNGLLKLGYVNFAEVDKLTLVGDGYSQIIANMCSQDDLWC